MQHRNVFHGVLTDQSQQMKHLVPRSHKFQTHFSLSKRQRSWPSERTTYNRQSIQRTSPSTVIADSQVVNCNRFSYQQVIHILPSLRATQWVLDSDRRRQVDPVEMPGSKSIPSQSTLSDRYIYDSAQDKPAIPLNIGGLLNMITHE